MVSTTSPFRAPPPSASKFKRENSGERKPFRPKPWSHQSELRQNQRIEISCLDGQCYDGTILDSDQFTVKIFLKDCKSALTVFKHAIRSYRIIANV